MMGAPCLSSAEAMAAAFADDDFRESVSKRTYKPHTTDITDITDKTTPWSDPLPLAAVQYPSPFDCRLLPDELAEIVGHVADCVQVPRELALGVALAVISTAIGKRAKVALPTHEEVSVLWVCIISPPGSRKSGCFKVLTVPLREIEAEMQEAWRDDWLQWKAEAELAEARIQQIKQESKKKGADRRALALELAEEKRTLDTEPVKPHLYLTDTTTEALRKALQDQGSIGLLSAEGSSLLEAFGRYNGGNRGADMALFLAAHDGDADRAARVTGTGGVSEALASIGITAQPDVLQTLGADRMAKGRGFTDRFLFLIPQDPRGSRNYRNQKSLSTDVLGRWEQIVRNIQAIEAPEEISAVNLTSDASEAWIEFAQGIEDRQQPGGDLRSMSGFASKLAGTVGRIALAYHFAKGRDIQTAIDKSAMLQAIGTGLVMLEHNRAALQLMGETESMVRARLVLEAIKRHELTEVTPRDIARNGWGGCKDAEEARAALSILVEHNYCRPYQRQRQGETGAHPKDAYEISPLLSEMSVMSAGVEA